mmetsp:Transcript_17295/g.47652  ORF Transcript_17295/g.47652 Transcript_17295/m.47652 type:complete len:282 (-) Transcript_17295:498-1343(-)
MRRAQGAKGQGPLERGSHKGDYGNPEGGPDQKGPKDSPGALPRRSLSVHERHGRPVGPEERPGALAAGGSCAVPIAVPIAIAIVVSGGSHGSQTRRNHVGIECAFAFAFGRVRVHVHVPKRSPCPGRDPAPVPKEAFSARESRGPVDNDDDDDDDNDNKDDDDNKDEAPVFSKQWFSKKDRCSSGIRTFSYPTSRRSKTGIMAWVTRNNTPLMSPAAVLLSPPPPATWSTTLETPSAVNPVLLRKFHCRSYPNLLLSTTATPGRTLSPWVPRFMMEPKPKI